MQVPVRPIPPSTLAITGTRIPAHVFLTRRLTKQGYYLPMPPTIACSGRSDDSTATI